MFAVTVIEDATFAFDGAVRPASLAGRAVFAGERAHAVAVRTATYYDETAVRGARPRPGHRADRPGDRRERLPEHRLIAAVRPDPIAAAPADQNDTED